MLMSESLAIAERIRAAMVERYGEEEAARRFRNFETICSATQERQDAILALLKRPLDLMIVIGGYNSSNTSNLAEIAGQRVDTFHIDSAESILDHNRIRHQPVGGKETVLTDGWLPDRPLTIGITAGASTPNTEIGAAILRMLQTLGLSLPELNNHGAVSSDQP
jgi:4-hydroxy-3-methylbut-2-enyl diphosphate reductase